MPSLSSVLSRASAALDLGVARLLERRMAAAPQRAPLPDGARARLLELARHYDGAALFAAPAAQPEVRATRAGSATWDLAFESAFRPSLGGYRDEHQRHRENLTAHARRWRAAAGAPAVILLHGWSQGPYWMTERMLERAAWTAAGYDVVALQLPLHGARAPVEPARAVDAGLLEQLGPRSGLLFPSPHVARTNESFGQAIWDLRVLARYLRADGAASVGVAGVSLGAYTAALWASLDDDLAFVLALTPAVALADLMWRHGAGSAAWKRAQQAGIDVDLLAEAFAVHAPTTRPVRTTRRIIVAGRGDRITPPEHAEALARHWATEPRWITGGHLAQLGRGAAMRAAITELAAPVAAPGVAL